MTEVKFFAERGILCGFSISGHSSVNCDDDEGKFVCSAVSSAAYMTANTITDVIGDKADISEREAKLSVRVKNPNAKTVTVLEGLRLHLEQLSFQYNDRISILSEV